MNNRQSCSQSLEVISERTLQTSPSSGFTPPLPTQRRIAACLKRETAQIDALVTQKETLLGMLEEKRLTTTIKTGTTPNTDDVTAEGDFDGYTPGDYGHDIHLSLFISSRF